MKRPSILPSVANAGEEFRRGRGKLSSIARGSLMCADLEAQLSKPWPGDPHELSDEARRFVTVETNRSSEKTARRRLVTERR